MYTRLKAATKTVLLRLQKVTRTDMLYATKGGFWLTFGSAVGTLASLAVVIAFANFAAKETYGSYKYLMAIAGTLAGFTLSGLGEALMGAAARGNDGTLRIFVRRAFRWNLAVAGAAFAGAAWYFWRGNAMLGGALVAIGLFLPLTQSTGLYAPFLRGKRLFQAAAKYNALRTLLPAAAMIMALWSFPDHPAALVAVFMGASAMASYGAYRRVARDEAKNADVEAGAMRFGAHTSLVNALGTFVGNLDKIVIFQTLGAVPTATYALAQAFPEQLDAVVGNLRALAIPKFAAQPAHGAFRTLMRKTMIVFLVMIPATAAAAALAPFAYGLLFPAYREAVPYAMALFAAQIPIGAAHLPMAFMTAHRDVSGRYALGIIGPLLNIILLLVLVGPFGIWGVVAAKIAVKSAAFAMTIFFSWRITRKPAESVTPSTGAFPTSP